MTENFSTELITEEKILTENLILEWIKFTDVRESSQKVYAKALRQLFKYFREKNISAPTRQDLADWRNEMFKTKKAATIQNYMVAAKLFFKFLSQNKIYPNIAEHLKSAKVDREHKKDALTVKQCQNLLNAVDISTQKGLRDRAIISLMMTAGLRTIEVCRANIEDLHKIGDSVFLTVQGKGHDDKAAKVLVATQVFKFIEEYLKTRGNFLKTEPLFTSTSRRNFNDRIKPQAVSRVVKKNLRKIFIDDSRHTAHSLRHTAATQALLNGVSLAQVQQVLRHTNINTTLIYTHAIERLKNKSEQTVADSIFLQ